MSALLRFVKFKSNDDSVCLVPPSFLLSVPIFRPSFSSMLLRIASVSLLFCRSQSQCSWLVIVLCYVVVNQKNIDSHQIFWTAKFTIKKKYIVRRWQRKKNDEITRQNSEGESTLWCIYRNVGIKKRKKNIRITFKLQNEHGQKFLGVLLHTTTAINMYVSLFCFWWEGGWARVLLWVLKRERF